MGELVQIFIDNIAPILIIAGLGYIVGRRKGVDPRPLGRVIFYIFSPGLIFDSLSKTRVEAAELGQIALTMTLFMSAMLVIAFFVARWRSPDRTTRAGLVLSAICPNNGNFGLPLIGFAFGEDVLARAVVVYIVNTFYNYTAGIFVASSGRSNVREALTNILRVPVVYAALAGLIVNATGFVLPPIASRSVGLVAQAAIPAMIVLLGLQLSQVSTLTHLKLAGVGTAMRLLISPALALAAVLLIGLQSPASVAVIMQASMPVAVVTIIFATEYGLDDKFMSSTILASTLVSPVTLSLLILILRQYAA